MADNDTEPTENTSQNIFVTGAGTGLGRAVVRKLVAHGFRVIGATQGTEEAAVVRSDGALPVYPDSYSTAQMVSLFNMAKARVVIHVEPVILNGLPHHRVDWEDYQEMLAGVGNVVQAAEQTGMEQLIYVSSASLYADADNAITEDGALDDNPALKNAISAEKAVLNGSVPGTVLRTGFVYGGEAEATQAIITAIIKGNSLSSSNGTMSWIHTEDLATAIVAVVTKENANSGVQVYNVADNTPVSADEFLESLATALGLPVPGQPRGFMERWQPAPASQQAILAKNTAIDSSRFREAFAWQPTYKSHQIGIDQMLMVRRAKESEII